MKGGGTEIERSLTFEKNSFTESKNHDLIFKFTIQNWGNSRCIWQLSPKAAICCIFSEHLLIRTPLDGCFFSEIPRAELTKNVEHHYGKLLRNLTFKVLISHCFETQKFLQLNSNVENTSVSSLYWRLMVPATAWCCTAALLLLISSGLCIPRIRGIYWQFFFKNTEYRLLHLFNFRDCAWSFFALSIIKI